jgi:hypothetical protein
MTAITINGVAIDIPTGARVRIEPDGGVFIETAGEASKSTRPAAQPIPEHQWGTKPSLALVPSADDWQSLENALRSVLQGGPSSTLGLTRRAIGDHQSYTTRRRLKLVLDSLIRSGQVVVTGTGYHRVVALAPLKPQSKIAV